MSKTKVWPSSKLAHFRAIGVSLMSVTSSSPIAQAKNLGVIINQCLFLSLYVQFVSKSHQFYLQNFFRIWPSLTTFTILASGGSRIWGKEWKIRKKPSCHIIVTIIIELSLGLVWLRSLPRTLLWNPSKSSWVPPQIQIYKPDCCQRTHPPILANIRISAPSVGNIQQRNGISTITSF